MLTMQCGTCGGSISYMEQFAGQTSACPKCKSEVILGAVIDNEPIKVAPPLTHADEVRLKRERAAEEDAKLNLLLKKAGIALGTLVLGAFAVFGVWSAVNWLGNSREREIKPQMVALAAEAEKLLDEKNFDAAELKNNELLKLAGEFKITDTTIRRIVDNASLQKAPIREGRFLAMVRDAKNLLGSKRLKEALKKFDEAIVIGQGIRDPKMAVVAALKESQAARDVIFPDVRAALERDEAEAAAIVAEAKRHETELANQARAAALAEEKRQDEMKKLAVLKLKYRNAPKSARDALNALKRIQAKTEVGVNKFDYSKQLGDSWGEVKIFVESPEGKDYSDLSDRMRRAIEYYKSAGEGWTIDTLRQTNWSQADQEIKVLDSALNQQ